MFGLLRFLLAIGIVTTHLSIGVDPFYYGASFVIIFYMISGFLMSYVWENKFEKKELGVKSFYLDRIIRIYPMYLTILYGKNTFVLFILMSTIVFSYILHLVLEKPIDKFRKVVREYEN